MARAESLATTPAASKKAAPRPALEVPADLAAALAKSAAARRHFEAFAPSKQRDYLEWVTEAKREATRASRIEQAVAWMAEGKARHWNHQACGARVQLP